MSQASGGLRTAQIATVDYDLGVALHKDVSSVSHGSHEKFSMQRKNSSSRLPQEMLIGAWANYGSAKELKASGCCQHGEDQDEPGRSGFGDYIPRNYEAETTEIKGI
jgi:hypothetical protein